MTTTTNSQVQNEAVLPEAVDAERAVLGSILINADHLEAAQGALQPSDFFSDSNRLIYEVMLHLEGRGLDIDIITVQEELRSADLLDRVGGPGYIVSLFDGVPRFMNIDSYLALVREAAVRRKLAKIGSRITSAALSGQRTASELLQLAEQAILAVADKREQAQFTGAGEVAAERLERVRRLAETGEMVTGLPTGYLDLDQLTTGMHGGQLILIGARPSMGKTAWMFSVALNVHDRDPYAVTAAFSLEMSKQSLIDRMMCQRATVDSLAYRQGRLSEAEFRRLELATEELASWKLEIDDSSTLTVPEIRARLRRLKQKHGRLDLVVIDYLQLLSPSDASRAGSRQQEIGQISRALKSLAKDFDVPVLVAVQLNREVEDAPDHRPQLHHLREAGDLEQDSDVVLFLTRPEFYRPDDRPGLAILDLAKQREGPRGCEVHLRYYGEFTRFEPEMAAVSAVAPANAQGAFQLTYGDG